MRFRSLLVLMFPLLFLSIPAANAQKRVFATVNPNADSINGNAEIYNPSTGKFTLTASMIKPREQHVAVTLVGGKVLIAGGFNNRYLTDVEFYNPSTGGFETIKDDNGNNLALSTARSGAASALLRGGRILIAGGYNGSFLSSVEVYDPTTERFTSSANSMNEARQSAAATRLTDGRVLITGGFNSAYVFSAEIYDPANGSFTVTIDEMDEPREGHTSTLLPDGNVLVVGGCNSLLSGSVVCDYFVEQSETYHPDYDAKEDEENGEDEADEFDDQFTNTAGLMVTARTAHTATLLASGKVLIVGGRNETGALAAAELYDPATETFTATGSLNVARYGHTASLLPNGRVLIAGGFNGDYLSSAEIYDPATGAFTPVSPEMTLAKYNHVAVTLPDGSVLMTGGRKSDFLVFDVNERSTSDNIAPNVVFSPDSQTGFVPYAGSGVVLAFSAKTGEVLAQIATGGHPAFITALKDGKTLAAVSVLDNKIFLINTQTLTLSATYSFTGEFGFGSILALSPDGQYGYVSSTASGEVVKFNVSTGAEAGRLTGLKAPAQITVTRDGNTLMIVDTSTTEVVFADSSTMKEKYTFDPANADDESQTYYGYASFTIFNKAVLNEDESVGIIGSRDVGSSLSASSLFLFDPSTGKIIDTDGDPDNGVDEGGVEFVGYQPGYTALLPTGKFWLILNLDSVTMIPTWWTASLSTVTSSSGSPLGGANIVFSPDAKYAYYTSSTADKVLQLDIGTQGIVGSFLVGDDPNESDDQASSLALTPDSGTMAVVLFASNQLQLLADETVQKQTKLISNADEFTGVSLINLSPNIARLTLTIISDGGSVFSGKNILNEDVVNPISILLAPNVQRYFEVSDLFLLDNTLNNSGRLVVASNQPEVVAFSMTGRVHASLQNPYVSSLQSIPLYPDYGDQLHHYIIPEIPMKSGTAAKLYFVNPNYNSSSYDVVHYATDGTTMRTSLNNSLNGSIRETKQVWDLVSSSQATQVLILGGFDSGANRQYVRTADLFSLSSKNFSTTAGSMESTRVGHTATSLQNNRVLIAGGKAGAGKTAGEIQRTSVLYDPTTNRFFWTNGAMKAERYRHTATLMANGKVLIAGGQNNESVNATAELYDPVDDEFVKVAAPMIAPRDAHTATLLADGRVLLAGGIDAWGVTASAEIYNPSGSVFTQTGSLNAGRVFHVAVLLPSGKVLIAGGSDGSNSLSSTELFDPSTGLFTAAAPMLSARAGHTGTLLANGTVLITGGKNSSGILSTAEIYDPVYDYFYPADGVMTYTRVYHTATLISPDPEDHTQDRVLIAGGEGIDINDKDNDDDEEEHLTLAGADIYDPNTQQFVESIGDMTSARQGHTATVLKGSDQGYLRIETGVGQLFTEIFDNGGAETAINGINVDKYAGITKIYSPQFVIAPPDFETHVNIINANEDYEATVTLTVHAPDGKILAGPLTRMLPVNAQWKGNLWEIFQFSPQLIGQTGWLEVSSSVEYIVGTMSITDPDPLDKLRHKFLASFELSGIPMRYFMFPFVSENTNYQTGISLLNAGDSTAGVRAELWDTSGTLRSSRTIALAPGHRISETLDTLFPGVKSIDAGNVRVLSDRPVHGSAFMFEREYRFLAPIPPVPYPGK